MNQESRMYRAFHYIGFSEGSSYLILLVIAMPLKYLWKMPLMVEVVGALHGFLFILYVLAATYLALRFKWSPRMLLTAYFASVIPFGPFLFDRKLQSQRQ